MSIEMIERVIQALRDNIDAALPEGVTLEYDYAARAAIEAMREPTKAMADAVREAALEPCFPESDWRRMIDAALSPSPNLEKG